MYGKKVKNDNLLYSVNIIIFSFSFMIMAMSSKSKSPYIMQWKNKKRFYV
jgi:hypothetical protein